jgi:prolipoprotein diacylglyceryl transferase
VNLAYIPSPPVGVWHLGPIPIRAYALCIIIGIIVACWWGDKRWVARGGKPGQVVDIAVWAVPFGLVGGRLYHVMTDFSTYFGSHGKGFVAALQVWEGGLGIWGAVALGAVGGAIGCKRAGISIGDFADAIAPCILAAQAIGRLGNYFNQELYGAVTTVPWGLQIFYRENALGQRGPDVIDGHSTGVVYAVVQPTFLYELVWNLLIVAVLVFLDRRFTLRGGRLFILYVAGYCLGRFFVELLREDHATHILGLRINTFTSGIIFLGAVAFFLITGRRRAATEDVQPHVTAGSTDEAPEDPAQD